MASGGTGTSIHIAGELFKMMAGVNPIAASGTEWKLVRKRAIWAFSCAKFVGCRHSVPIRRKLMSGHLCAFLEASQAEGWTLNFWRFELPAALVPSIRRATAFPRGADIRPHPVPLGRA
jgi:hypothetical protein